MTELTSDRAKRERSPAFPFINLSKALDRAEQMLSAHRRSPARPTVVGETWNYSPSSSAFIQTIAALRAYGLLEDTGRGDDRRIQLSELAVRILTDARPGAREAGIREAATKPKLMLEFMGMWLPEKPVDAHRISDLTLDRGFTKDAAKSFLRIFDDNVSFAKLNNDDKVEDVSEEVHVEDVSHPTALPQERPARSGMGVIAEALRRNAPPPAQPAAILPLPEGVVSLTLPSELSERSVSALKSWIEVMIGLAKKQPDAS